MSEEENEVQTVVVKFCPICGGTMHKAPYLGSDWWLCDDEEGCGFLEPA